VRQRISHLHDRLQRAKQSLQSFKVEMREVPRDQIPVYELKAKEHHMSLQQLQGDLEWAKSEHERSGLGLRNADEMTTMEIIQQGSRTQDQSLSSLQRMRAQIADSMQATSRASPPRFCSHSIPFMPTHFKTRRSAPVRLSS